VKSTTCKPLSEACKNVFIAATFEAIAEQYKQHEIGMYYAAD